MFNTHPNTVNVQRHRPNTIQYPPKHSPGTIYALIEVNRNKLHQQTLPDIPRPSQVLFEDGWSLKVSVDVTWCLLVCVGFFCCLDMSCYVGGGGGVGVMGVYEWCLWVSEVFAGVWRVISVLIPWMVENSYCFGIVLKSQIVFTRPNWEIKMSTYILNKNGWVLSFFSSLVFVREKLKDTFTWITLYCCWRQNLQKKSILARIFGLWQGFKDKSCPGQEIIETRTR